VRHAQRAIPSLCFEGEHFWLCGTAWIEEFDGVALLTTSEIEAAELISSVS
jgi:hypothetical protein